MRYKIIYWAGFILYFIFGPALGLNAELAVLTDGSKISGRVEDRGTDFKIITPNGEFIIAKAEIRIVYQNVTDLLDKSAEKTKEATDRLKETEKIDDLSERNRALNKCLELFKEAKKICLDGLDVFGPAEEKLIATQITDINMALKYVRSLKVFDMNIDAKPTRPDSIGTEPNEEKQRQKLADDFYRDALGYFESNEYRAGLENLLKALAYIPDFPPALAKLGNVYGRLKDEEKSLHYYQACLKAIEKHQPDLPEEERLLRQEVLPKVTELETLSQDIVMLDNQIIEDLVGLGVWAVDNRDYLLATDIFNLALEIAPENQDLNQYLRETEELAGREENTGPVREQNPALADLYYELGMKNLKKNFLQSRNYFRKAVSYDNNQPMALFRLAVIYENLHASREAINYYYRCVKSLMDKETLPEAETKIMSQAQTSLERLDILSKNFFKIKEEKADQLLKLGESYYNRQYEKFAARVFKQVLMFDPENKTAFNYLKKLEPSYLADEIETDEEEIAGTFDLNRPSAEWETEKVYIDQMLGASGIWRKLDRIQWYKKLLTAFSLEITHAASDQSGKMLDIILEEKKGKGDKYEFFIRPSIAKFRAVKSEERDCLVYLLKNSRIIKTGNFTAVRETPLKITKQGDKLSFLSAYRKILEFKSSDLKQGVFRIGLATSNNIGYDLHTVKIRGKKE